MEKHGGREELMGWHEMVDKYKSAIRYLRQHDLPVPHPDVLRKKNREVMTRYINKVRRVVSSGYVLRLHFLTILGLDCKKVQSYFRAPPKQPLVVCNT